MGNRSMNIRKGVLRYMELQTYESVSGPGFDMTGLRFKFPDGDKDSGAKKKGKTLYSACMPHVRDWSFRTPANASPAT